MAPLRRQLDYLNRLCGRLQVRGFPTDDPLRVKALKAHAAVLDLHAETVAPTLPRAQPERSNAPEPAVK